MPAAGWWARRFLIRSACCRVNGLNFPLNIPASYCPEVIARCARTSLKARPSPAKRLFKCLVLKDLVLKDLVLKDRRLKLRKNETLLEPRLAVGRLCYSGPGTSPGPHGACAFWDGGSALCSLPENSAASGCRRDCCILTRFQHCRCHRRQRRG